jgi:predicted RNA-binding Zn-ribbon protein involved in translation (DUF1610 family)
MFFFRKKPIVARCGHPVKRKTKVVVMGKKEKLRVANENAVIELCPECMAKIAIRCVKCGRIIFPGDPITFYKSNEIGRKYSRYATSFDNSNLFIGCIFGGCREFAFCTGYWVAPGKVQLMKDFLADDDETKALTLDV